MLSPLKEMTVHYEKAKFGFRNGDLFFQSHGDWTSWKNIQVEMVRIFTLSTFSHSGVINVDTDGNVYAVEAVEPSVHRVPMSTRGDFYHVSLPEHMVKWSVSTDAYIKRIIGTPYSRIDAVRAYFGPLPAGMVSECAAMTREVMIRAGVDLGTISRPDTVWLNAMELGATVQYISQSS